MWLKKKNHKTSLRIYLKESVSHSPDLRFRFGLVLSMDLGRMSCFQSTTGRDLQCNHFISSGCRVPYPTTLRCSAFHPASFSRIQMYIYHPPYSVSSYLNLCLVSYLSSITHTHHRITLYRGNSQQMYKQRDCSQSLQSLDFL